MSGTLPGHSVQSRSRLLTIYLNDHYAGATAGVALAHRVVAQHRESSMSDALTRLAAEVAEDRDALRALMRRVGVPNTGYKSVLAWSAERVGRLKLNGQLRGRSPLSTLVELEAMRLGVEGKWSGWRTLRELSETDSRLDSAQLDGLIARARSQADTVEELRVRAAAEALAGR